MPAGDYRKLPVDDREFARLYSEIGLSQLSARLGIGERNLLKRRAGVERRLGIRIKAPNSRKGPIIFQEVRGVQYPGRIEIDIKNGMCLVGSDCHYWPGEPSLMHRAFVHFCKELKPNTVILNGDVIDACSISRHPPIGWESQPSIQEEIEGAQARLAEIERAAGKARKIWPLGNHDSRFETKLATVAPEYAKIAGVHLRDHFPLWEPCWSVFINKDVVVKHRFKGGIHAPRNNTLNSGRTTVTGHLHSQKVMPLTDYNGTRYGVDTGCIADPSHKAFVDYTEDNAKDWRDGFVVLTFLNGELLPPELVSRWSSTQVVFRGKIIKV